MGFSATQMDPELKYELYGFRGQKWIRISRNTGFSGPTYYYARVPDEFEFKYVDHCGYKWRDANYCDDLEGFNITCCLPGHENSHLIEARARSHYHKELPYGDPELYKVVDILLETGKEFGLKINIKDEYSESHDGEVEINYKYDCADILDLAEAINDRSTESNRKINLLQGTSIFDLVDKLDETNEMLKDTKSELDEEKDKNKELQNVLDRKDREITQLRMQFDRLYTEHSQLKAEREGYQKAIVEKIRETLSTM